MLALQTAIVKMLGYEFEAVSFQPGTSDFTAVATKVLTTNADVCILGMNDTGLFQLMRSLRTASFPGICLCPTEFLPGELSKIGTLTELDGLITGCLPTATDSPNAIAQEQMADYAAKYGAWTIPTSWGAICSTRIAQRCRRRGASTPTLCRRYSPLVLRTTDRTARPGWSLGRTWGSPTRPFARSWST